MRNRITTTIEREPFADIIDGRKHTEYRDIKPYWRKKLATVTVPFEMRLINGMLEPKPEVTIVVDRVRRNAVTRRYELHIARVLRYSNWDRRRRLPTRSPNVAQPPGVHQLDRRT